MTAAIKRRVAGRVFKSPDKLEPVMLVRRLPGQRSEEMAGEWVKGGTTETVIRAAVAPITGKEREVLPEGLRGRDIRKFWTESQVRAVTEGKQGSDGDMIRHEGLLFQAYQVNDWGSFREVIGIEHK